MCVCVCVCCLQIKYNSSNVAEEELLRLVNQLEINAEGWIDYGSKINLFLNS